MILWETHDHQPRTPNFTFYYQYSYFVYSKLFLIFLLLKQFFYKFLELILVPKILSHQPHPNKQRTYTFGQTKLQKVASYFENYCCRQTPLRVDGCPNYLQNLKYMPKSYLPKFELPFLIVHWIKEERSYKNLAALP